MMERQEEDGVGAVMRAFLIGLTLAVVACARDPKGTSTSLGSGGVDTGRVAVPGSSLFFEAAGSGSPVVLLHGGNLDRRMWDAEWAALQATHRAIRYDARGFGRSGPADSAFQAHEDLRTLLDSIRIARATLIGLSLGGRIAIDFALAYPERVDRLVLVAPGISGGKWADDGDTTWLRVARRAAAVGDTIAVARAWLQSAYIRTALRHSAMAPKVKQWVLDQVPFWGGIVRHQDLEVEATPPAAGRLAELAMPILLILGTDDTPFIQDVAAAIAREGRRVQRIDLPGIGHMVNLEAPEAFRAAVDAFLAR
jgi:pimeloyl-ACP methyl ester carboxylesterase